MKNIIFAVYDEFSHDQRAMETIESLAKIGEVTVVSYGKIQDTEKIHCVVTGNGQRDYIAFRKGLIYTYKKIKPDFVFLHDDYTAFFIGWLKKQHEDVKIAYDASELYYDKFEMTLNGFKAYALERDVRRYLPAADFVFSANIERALIMKDVYKLKRVPIVWDNIHRIDDSIDEASCKMKYDRYLNGTDNIILYCGGIREDRGTYQLIDAIEQLGGAYKLLVAGIAGERDLKKFNERYEKSCTKNFYYLGYLSRSELRFLLRKSKISVSLFDFSCANHIFCASGKVFEALFEHIPVLTSINPPFKRLCDDFGVGVSTNDFRSGIIEIVNNYETYVENVSQYVKQLTYETRVEQLAALIEKELSVN